jgi:exosortase
MTRSSSTTAPLDHGAGPRAGWLSPPALLVQLVALAIPLGFHYRHVIRRLIDVWSNDGDWSHGFIIPVFGIYYLYLQRDRYPRGLGPGGAVPRVAGALLLAAGFGLHMASALYAIEYPKTISLVANVMGVVLLVGGWPVARWSWFAVAFLLFAMPLPVTLYQQITMPLREIAAHVSAWVLCMVPEMQAEAQGTIVDYIYKGRAGTPLDIEQACSGMRLLMTMMALGVAMAFVNERALWHRMVMILACVPIAVFCNIIRVTTTGFFVVFERAELARGMWHMLLGLGMLGIAFGLYGGISYVLSHLFVEGEPPGLPGEPVPGEHAS